MVCGRLSFFSFQISLISATNSMQKVKNVICFKLGPGRRINRLKLSRKRKSQLCFPIDYFNREIETYQKDMPSDFVKCVKSTTGNAS